MRLLTFIPQSGTDSRVGVLHGDRVTDLTQLGGKLPFDAHDMLSLIDAGDSALAWLKSNAPSSTATLALSQVKVLAPVPRPRKNVFCVGWNYLEHFKEGEKNRDAKVELPDHPVFFSKSPTSVNGPYDPIPYQAELMKMLDWEVELGVIIGRNGKNITEANAMQHIFGYTVVNDVSARDVQRRHGGQWFKGKSLDGACPMGPVIVTADEVDCNNLQVICRVNGVVKQDSNTSYMYFKIPRLLAEISAGMTLESGDIISTGTPQGVGMGRTPPEFLHPGDVLETEIVGFGVMRNTIGS